MFKRKEIPVYMFTGLLESGKTSFLRDTFRNGEFYDGMKSLLLMCEEGIEELDEKLLTKNRTTMVKIDEQSTMNEITFSDFEEKYRPDRILIENNGMWNPEEIVKEFPENWMLVQVIATVDSTTFTVYSANMKMLLMNQLKTADLVVFNRCELSMDRGFFRRNVKALNRRAQIIYESENGELDDQFEEELPYDINAPLIELEDDDFGLFYLDVMDNPDKYKDKKVHFLAQVYRDKKFRENVMAVGRFAMTCCAEDIQYIGFFCRAENASEWKQRDWVKVTAVIGVENQKQFKGRGPVLRAEEVVAAEKPEDEIVYFS